MSNWLICTVNRQSCHLPYWLNLDLSPTCWRPPAPGIIFHLLHPSLNLLHRSKTHVQNMLSSYTCLSISSVCVSFPQLDQRFQAYSLLCVHSWKIWKRGGANKSIWEKRAMITVKSFDGMLTNQLILFGL